MRRFCFYQLLFYPLALLAQLPPLPVKVYSLDEIPGEYKSKMVQDGSGYVWIPTSDGLYRYDGFELKHYFHIQSDASSLSVNFVSCVYPDNDGTIWAGTIDGGLNHLDPLTGKCKIYRYSKNDPSSVSSDRILSIKRDSHNRLWIGTDGSEGGINIFNEKKNNFQRIKLGENSLPGDLLARNNTVNFINETQNGDVLFSTYDGLWIFDDGKFSVYRCDTLSSRLRNNLMGATLEYPGNVVWICTWGGGIKRFDCNTKTFETFLWNQENKNIGTTNIAHDIVKKNDSLLWIGSVDRGLGLLNTISGRFQFYPPTTFGLSQSTYGVYNLLTERSGDIWMVFDNSTCGIVNSNKQPVPFTSLKLRTNKMEPAPVVSGIAAGETGKLLMTTTWSDGYYVFDERSGSLRPCETPTGEVVKGGNLFTDHLGNTWTVSGTLYRADAVHAKLIPYEPLQKKQLPVLRQAVEDSDHNLWFITNDGLVFYDWSKDSIVHYPARLLNLKPGSDLHGIICDANNNIWVGSDQNGVYIFNVASKKFSNLINTPLDNRLPFNTITGFAADNANRIWLCGIGGVAVCTTERGRRQFKSFSFENGLANNHISDIAFDGKNTIWVNGSGNISTINTVDFSIHNINRETFNNKSITSINVDRRGDIYLGSEMGFMKFKPSDIHSDTVPPRIVINDFKIFDKSFPIFGQETVSLKYDQNYFSFDFAAISFSDAAHCHYRYMLEGFDKTWVNAGSRRYAAYTNIPGGHYVFRVTGANADGVWNTTGLSIPIFISTPWWKTVWFYCLAAGLIAVLVYVVYRYRIQQILRLQKMRAQIASDLHDDIGSTLTSISFYSEMVKMQLSEHNGQSKNLLDKMGSSARSMVSAMSDIVWVINPSNDTTNNLLEKLKTHAAQILGERNITYEFETDELKRSKLNMQQKKNIFLIFKEALNNAIKYSECSRIRIRFLQAEKNLLLEIRDDGNGFDVASAINGNGLSNMKARAHDMGAMFSIDSQRGAGTVIYLSLKIT